MRYLIAFIFGLTLGVVCEQAEAGHCGYLYQHHAVQAVVAPYVTYSVGDDIRLNALAQKIVDRAAPQIAAAVAQQLRADPAQPGALAVKAPALLAQKCARCHSAGKNSLVLDGSPITLEQSYRFDEIFGKRRNIPDEMKALVASIKPEDIGSLKEEMMDLPIQAAKKPDPVPIPGELQ